MTRVKMLLVASLMAFVAGCASAPAQSVDLKADAMAYNLPEVTVERGKPVRLVLQNNDGQVHDFSVDRLPVKLRQGAGESHGDHDMGGKAPALHVAAVPGGKGEVEFVPTEAGTYTFYCAVPGHADAGMKGTLVVQ